MILVQIWTTYHSWGSNIQNPCAVRKLMGKNWYKKGDHKKPSLLFCFQYIKSYFQILSSLLFLLFMARQEFWNAGAQQMSFVMVETNLQQWRFFIGSCMIKSWKKSEIHVKLWFHLNTTFSLPYNLSDFWEKLKQKLQVIYTYLLISESKN
jgi:hypothetical protein